MSGPWEDYQKEQKGPWEDYAETHQETGSKTGTAQATLDHYANTMSAGYLPQLEAAAGGLAPDPNEELDKGLTQQGFEIHQPKNDYLSRRDASSKRIEMEGKEHPIASGVGTAGGVLGSIALPAGKALEGASLGAKALQGAKIGGAYGLIANPADKEGEMGPQIEERIKNGAIGAALGGAVPVALEGASAGSKKVSEYLKKKAGGLAETATGATGAQSSKFQEGAGRELLDRGLVKFGDTAEKVGKRTGAAMDEASGHIDEALKALDAKGVTASADNVVTALNEKIASLKKDPSQAGLVKKLSAIVDDIVDTGRSNTPVSEAEVTKRGFNKAAGNWMDPEAGEAGKSAYLAYMDEVEKAANAADPSLASKFTEGKKTYGLLAPIREAAEKRAMQQNQSPIGGFGDMLAAGVGGVKGFIAKRVLQPRIASSAAVTANKLGKGIGALPALAEKAANSPIKAQVMAQRLARGTASFEHDDEMDSILKNPQLMDIYRKDPSRVDAIQNDAIRVKVRRALKQGGNERSPTGDR